MNEFSGNFCRFIRTGNYPLEANYYFDSEADLLSFYREPINRTTLHKGLLKVVGNQDLYWVAELEGQLYFKKLISISTLEDIKNNEVDIKNIQDILDRYDLAEIVKKLDAVADLNTERAKKIVGTEDEDIFTYLDSLPYGSITSLSEAIENLIADLETKATKESLQTLSELVEFIKRTHGHDIHNLQSELDQTQVGVGLSGDGAYNADKETTYLQDATSVMHALRILDGKLRDALEGASRLLDTSYYDPSTEDLVLIFKTANDTNHEVRIPAGDLIEEWEVVNPADSAVTLTKTRNIQGRDTLSADVKISSKNNNSLQRESDGLYAKQTETNLDYVDGTLQYSINGEIVKTIPLVDKLLVSPTLSVNWEIFNQDGTTPTGIGSTSSATALTLERGYKVKGTFNFKWDHDNTKKDPTSTSGVCGTTLPSSGQLSSNVVVEDITTNRTFTQSISSPKTGFMVSGTSVIAASGNDTTSSSVSVSFTSKVYYGVSTSSTSVITSLANSKQQSNRINTLTGITATSDQYFVYAYPKDLGALTKITQNGASPVIEDFNRTEQTVTNLAGLDIVYYVYTSKNKGAFTNVELKFE